MHLADILHIGSGFEVDLLVKLPSYLWLTLEQEGNGLALCTFDKYETSITTERPLTSTHPSLATWYLQSL